MKSFRIISTCMLGGLLILFSCKKKFDEPAKTEPANSGYITIDSIYKKFDSYYVTSTVSPTKYFRFSGDVNLECTVTADEVSGNIYKIVYVEDVTGGLQVKLLNKGQLYVGDKIRINLNNVVLDSYAGMVQLDSIDINKRIAKISSGNPVTPLKTTFNALMQMTNQHSKLQSRLVILDSVEFSTGDKCTVFADAVNKNSKYPTLINSAGKTLSMSNSGYSNFATSIMPAGTGSIVAIVSQYGTTSADIQLLLRDINDVKLASGTCPIAVKNFDDGKISDPSNPSQNWTTYHVTGTVNWVSASYNSQKYAQISNYSGGANSLCETWLISPSMDISSKTNPRFSFQSAYNYSGPALEVWVSTNYTGGAPSSATWTQLSPTLSSGSWAWAGSGSLSLNSYKSSNTRIAFKYTGTSSSGSTWEIDDIAVLAD